MIGGPCLVASTLSPGRARRSLGFALPSPPLRARPTWSNAPAPAAGAGWNWASVPPTPATCPGLVGMKVRPLSAPRWRRSRLVVRVWLAPPCVPVSLPQRHRRRRSGCVDRRRAVADRRLRGGGRRRQPARSGLGVGRVALAAGARRLGDVGAWVGLAAVAVAVPVVPGRSRIGLGRGCRVRGSGRRCGHLGLRRVPLASATAPAPAVAVAVAVPVAVAGPVGRRRGDHVDLYLPVDAVAAAPILLLGLGVCDLPRAACQEHDSDRAEDGKGR